MADGNNPTMRLYRMMDRFMSFGKKKYDNYSHRDPSVRDIWMEAFGISNTSERQEEELRNSLMEAMRLLVSSEQVVSRNDSMNQNLYKSQFDRVREIIFSVEALSWSEFRERFSDDFLLALRWSADGMSNYVNEILIQDAALKSLQEEVAELIESVLTSNLPDELKRSLGEGLASIQAAILDYRFYGAEGIRNAVDRNVVLIHRHFSDIESIDDSESKSVIVRAFQYVWKVDKVVSKASRLKALAEPVFERIFPMLGSGG